MKATILGRLSPLVPWRQVGTETSARRAGPLDDLHALVDLHVREWRLLGDPRLMSVRAIGAAAGAAS